MYIEPEYLKHILKLNLRDIFIQNWFSQIENSSRCEFYGIFKREFKLESHLLNLSPYEREVLTKFRCYRYKLGDGTIFQEKIDYVSYVIYKILEMNIIIYLNVLMLISKD